MGKRGSDGLQVKTYKSDVCFTSKSNWLGTLTPLIHPIIGKTKTNHDSHAHRVFLALIYFENSLVHCLFSFVIG